MYGQDKGTLARDNFDAVVQRQETRWSSYLVWRWEGEWTQGDAVECFVKVEPQTVSAPVELATKASYSPP